MVIDSVAEMNQHSFANDVSPALSSSASEVADRSEADAVLTPLITASDSHGEAMSQNYSYPLFPLTPVSSPPTSSSLFPPLPHISPVCTARPILKEIFVPPTPLCRLRLKV